MKHDALPITCATDIGEGKLIKVTGIIFYGLYSMHRNNDNTEQ